MKRKVHRVAEALAVQISRWEGVEAVLLGEAADIETFDPYFMIDLDVFFSTAFPQAEERQERFLDVKSFESSPVSTVDRFVLEELPFSLHYMNTVDIDRMIHRILDGTWIYHEPGTNMFYRIEKGKVLYSRGGWLAAVRASRAEIPPGFWRQVRMRALAASERALSDLGAAAFSSDDLFFTVSAARLVRGVASFLFAQNRYFEPSGRMMYNQLKELPDMPDGFLGRLDSFVKMEEGLSPDAKREIAEHMVRSLLTMARASD